MSKLKTSIRIHASSLLFSSKRNFHSVQSSPSFSSFFDVAVKHIPRYGFSRECLELAAVETGLSRAFGGASDIEELIDEFEFRLLEKIREESETLLFGADTFESRLAILVSRRMFHLGKVEKHWAAGMASGLSNKVHATNRLLWISDQLCAMAFSSASEVRSPPLFWRTVLIPLLASSELVLIGSGGEIEHGIQFAKNGVRSLAEALAAAEVTGIAISSIASAVPSIISPSPLDQPIKFLGRLVSPSSYARMIWGDSLFDAFIPPYKFRSSAVESLSSSDQLKKAVSWEAFDLRGSPSSVAGRHDTFVDFSIPPPLASTMPFSLKGLTDEQLKSLKEVGVVESIGSSVKARQAANQQKPSEYQKDSWREFVLPISSNSSLLNPSLNWKLYNPVHKDIKKVKSESVTHTRETLGMNRQIKENLDGTFGISSLYQTLIAPSLNWIAFEPSFKEDNKTKIDFDAAPIFKDKNGLEWKTFQPSTTTSSEEAYLKAGLQNGEKFLETRQEVPWESFAEGNKHDDKSQKA